MSEDPILTRAEAMAFTKQPTPRAFDDWRRKFGVRSVGLHRYSRKHLLLALNREAGEVHMPASLRRKSA